MSVHSNLHEQAILCKLDFLEWKLRHLKKLHKKIYLFIRISVDMVQARNVKTKLLKKARSSQIWYVIGTAVQENIMSQINVILKWNGHQINYHVANLQIFELCCYNQHNPKIVFWKYIYSGCNLYFFGMLVFQTPHQILDVFFFLVNREHNK